jgi:CBS domain-containing protein
MDRRVEAWNVDRATMLCPICGFENLKGGDEVCVNCGADLAGHDIPQPALSFQSRLLGEHLDDLDAPAPLTVGPDLPVDVAIARMQEAETDCVLVTVNDRLVGIFTDRDAVVKAAGKHLEAFQVRDFMTVDPVVLRHDDPIALAIHKMAVGGFRHIPIIENGHPTGVITARDVFHHLAETLS